MIFTIIIIIEKEQNACTYKGIYHHEFFLCFDSDDCYFLKQNGRFIYKLFALMNQDWFRITFFTGPLLKSQLCQVAVR